MKMNPATRVATVIATVGIALGAVAVPVANAATASTPTAAVNVSAACTKATATHAKAFKGLKKAKATGSNAKIAKAKKKVTVTKKAKARACKTGTTAPTTTGTTETSSGTPTTRPPAGSGLPGSNAEIVQMTGCPLTFSAPKVNVDISPATELSRYFGITVIVRNASAKPVPARVEVDAVDADGEPLWKRHIDRPVKNAAGVVVRTEREDFPGVLTIIDHEVKIPGNVDAGRVGEIVAVGDNNPDVAGVKILDVRVTCLR